MINAAPFLAPLSFLIVITAIFWRAFYEVANPKARKLVHGESIALTAVGFVVFWSVALGLAGG